MKAITLVSIFIIILMAGNIFTGYKFISLKNNASEIVAQDEATILRLEGDLKTTHSNFRQSMNWQYQYENFKLKNGEYLTKEGKSQDLYSLIKASPVLIYRITSQSCDVCYDNITQKLKGAGDAVGDKKIIVIVPMDELRNTVSAFISQGIKATILATNDQSALGVPLETSTSPFFFVAGPSLTGTHILIPHKNGVDITQDYLSVMQEKFFLP